MITEVLSPLIKASRPARGAWIEITFTDDGETMVESRPARGAWIEIMLYDVPGLTGCCRAPHGARGLKCSAPADVVIALGRAPHGARGLKLNLSKTPACQRSRAPHGARGLKFCRREGGQAAAPGRAPHGARGLK